MENVLISGANKGIGLQLVITHLKRGDKVTAVCREPSIELKKSGAQIVENIDFLTADFEHSLLIQTNNQKFDRVIANAGVREVDTFSNFNPDAIKEQFEVNALAPLRLIKALQSRLNKEAKVLLISTRVASLKDNRSGQEFGYRMSKTALNMVGVNLAHALKEVGISVFLFHPGFVRTNLTKGEGLIDANQSAQCIVNLADELELFQTGSFWHAIEKEQLPW